MATIYFKHFLERDANEDKSNFKNKRLKTPFDFAQGEQDKKRKTDIQKTN